MPMGACPECDADVLVTDSPKIDQHIQCANCGSELVIIGLTPIELDWAFAEPFEVKPYNHRGHNSAGKPQSRF
jgi:lysine biosynthesis protein LysW